MSRYTLTHTRLKEGLWEAEIAMAMVSDDPPQICVTHLEAPLDGIVLQPGAQAGIWVLQVSVPASLISDGVQTFVVSDLATGDVVDSFTLICGDAVTHDIRAEVDLLRAELDLLKRAFRRHCLETK